MKDTRAFVFFVMFVFVLSLTGASPADGSNRAGQPQTQSLRGKRTPQL